MKYAIADTDTMNVPPQNNTVLKIEDGNALFHSMKEIPGKFRQKSEIKRIHDGVEDETRKSQASFQIIQVSPEALPRMRLE